MTRGSLLVVDDNSGIRKLLDELFSAEGYAVTTAASGLEAIKLAQKHVPDLVLLDLKMPGMNGIELREKLVSLDHDIRIVLMSAYTERDETKDMAHKVDCVIAKPFNLDNLLMIIAGLLNEKK